MALLKVTDYQLGYHVPTKKFYLHCKLQKKLRVDKLILAPDEFMALSYMFKQEGPIYFNTETEEFCMESEEMEDDDPPRGVVGGM